MFIINRLRQSCAKRIAGIPCLHGQKTCRIETLHLFQPSKGTMSISCQLHTSLLDLAERKLGLFLLYPRSHKPQSFSAQHSLNNPVRRARQALPTHPPCPNGCVQRPELRVYGALAFIKPALVSPQGDQPKARRLQRLIKREITVWNFVKKCRTSSLSRFGIKINQRKISPIPGSFHGNPRGIFARLVVKAINALLFWEMRTMCSA